MNLWRPFLGGGVVIYVTECDGWGDGVQKTDESVEVVNFVDGP